MRIMSYRIPRRFLATSAIAIAAVGPAHAQSFVKETAANLPNYNIYRPSDLATRRTRTPVITWINGGCARRDSGAPTLFERWASAGYFVITVNDPTAPIPNFRRPEGGAAAQPRPMPQMPPGGIPAGVSIAGKSPDDQAKAISWAEAENKAKGSPYAGKLDVKRIIAAGNSCGGISSLVLGARDKRVKSIYVLSGSSAGPGASKEAVSAIMGKITAPVIWVVGGTEDIARGPANIDYDLLTPGVAAEVVQRSSGGHGVISTNPAVHRDAAEMGLLWFRATLYGDRAAAATVAGKGCAECDPAIWTVKSKNLVRR